MDCAKPRLLPAGVLARRLGVTARWLLDEHSAGRLPGVQTDRTVLFEPDVVEDALLARARRDLPAVVDNGGDSEAAMPA